MKKVVIPAVVILLGAARFCFVTRGDDNGGQYRLVQVDTVRNQTEIAVAARSSTKVTTTLLAAIASISSTVVSPVAVVIAIAFSAGVGIFFGFYPARKAAALNPIEALRYE